MTIGALSAYGFQPYVYNTNTVSASSMNKLSRISDDVLDKKIDYSELADESKNVNPLKKGQTLDFQAMLEMQMQRGQNNAVRVMKPAQTQEDDGEAEQASEAAIVQMNETAVKAAEQTAAVTVDGSADMADANAGNANISYQMQQALNAYEMFMTA
ncbi:MAG: hypothetical protein NC416_13110 [Eubacterium sp.]|nr:hypothetical protein [Eubacterium sp.]